MKQSNSAGVKGITVVGTSKIKVAILNTYVPVPSINGGIEYTRHLVKYLSRRDDVELHILTLAYKNITYEKKDLELLTLHRIEKPFGYPLSFPLANLYLRHEIEGIHPEIVHVLGAGPIYSPAVASVRHEYPTVMTSLGFTPYGMKFASGIEHMKYLLVGKASEKYVFSKIPNVMVQALFIADLVRSMTRSKVYVVPPGVEFEDIQRIPPHQGERPDIFGAFRLHQIKGIDILIKAIAIVVKLVPDIKLYIAGGGPQEQELRSLVRELRLDDHVKFLGVIYGEEKYRYYKACKIAVVPSRWDCQPFGVLDAAAAGKPVVASRMSNPDIVADGETGLLFESENVEELAAKVIRLLTDERLRNKMGKAVLEKVREYDWSRIAEKTVKVYREIIADFHKQNGRKK